MANDNSLRNLTSQFTKPGKLDAIYLRPARGVDCVSVPQATAIAKRGLEGDRAAQRASTKPLGSNRQVTLIQAEHMPVIASLIGKAFDPAGLRRNLLVSGINLLAAKSLFKDQPLFIKIGEVVLEVTGPCEPCSQMEKLLGHGGYNAMRGHGGLTARVITGGVLNIEDTVAIELVRFD